MEVLGAYYPGVLGSNLTTGKTNTKLFFRELAGPNVVFLRLLFDGVTRNVIFHLNMGTQ